MKAARKRTWVGKVFGTQRPYTVTKNSAKRSKGKSGPYRKGKR